MSIKLKKYDFNSIEDFFKEFDIIPKTLAIYRRAFTHPSFIKSRNKEYTRNNNYQDLEFLGDSILQFLSSEYIFKMYKKLDAGQLTLIRSKLVCTNSLNEISDKLCFKNFLFTGPGLMHNEVIKSNKVGADIFESFIAALYLDLGIKAVQSFLKKTLYLYAENLENTNLLKDSKTIFQEYIQSFSKQSVTYKTTTINQNHFYSEAIHDNQIYGYGYGKSKNKAEESAANNALEKLKK